MQMPNHKRNSQRKKIVFNLDRLRANIACVEILNEPLFFFEELKKYVVGFFRIAQKTE